MIETRLISISKPRKSYSTLVAKTEVVEDPKTGLKFKVTRLELEKVQKEATCHTCDKEIRKGASHKTAQVVLIDRENGSSQTRHLPLHLDCEFKNN